MSGILAPLLQSTHSTQRFRYFCAFFFLFPSPSVHQHANPNSEMYIYDVHFANHLHRDLCSPHLLPKPTKFLESSNFNLMLMLCSKWHLVFLLFYMPKFLIFFFSSISSTHFIISFLHFLRVSCLCLSSTNLHPNFDISQNLYKSMSNTTCGSTGDEITSCRDSKQALALKMVALVAILLAGVVGIAIPLVGKKRRFLRTDSNLFFAAKAFAAGVILATGFVHMLPDAESALTDPCLPETPWSKFPFSGFFAMIAALITLLVDFVGTQYYENKQEKKHCESGQVDSSEPQMVSDSGIIEVKESNEKVFGEEEGGGMHIVGMHAHAAHHRHNRPQGEGACEGHIIESFQGHSHGFGDSDDDAGVRHVVVSQVLELGIVSHSVIIGFSLGVSQSPCTIRPLIGALSFHQFFEGFALGGCIAQAQFHTLHTTLMACFFAITTPLGIAIGSAVSSFYSPNSPRALVIEGIFDSISAGILVYMALVDLIAADFLSKRMKCNVRLQLVSYFTLFLGALLMSLLAIWA